MDAEHWERLVKADWKAIFLLKQKAEVIFEDCNDKYYIDYYSSPNCYLRVYLTKLVAHLLKYEIDLSSRGLLKHEIISSFSSAAKDLLRDPSYDLKEE